MMKIIGSLMFCFVVVVVPLEAGLSEDIADLRRKLAESEQRLDQSLASVLRTDDLGVRVAPQPLVDLINGLGGLEQTRKTHASVAGHSGQLAGTHSDCHVFGVKTGETGWYVEFANPNHRAFIDLALANVNSSWNGQGLTVTGAVKLYGEVGLLRWHADPTCVGGGAGGHAGPASCSGSTAVSASLTLGALAGSNLPYQLRANTKGAPVSCSINAGSLGSISYNVQDALPRTDMTYDGSLALPLELEGTITIPVATPIVRNYRFALQNAAAQASATGITATSDIALHWQP